MNLSKRQEAELVTAIQGRGEIPLKFAYLGEGAKNWDAVAKERSDNGGGINLVEADLLKKRLDDFLSTLNLNQGINVIDMGCGNGTPILPVLQRMKSNGITFTYVPMDISQEMLDLATKNVSEQIPDVLSKPVLMDFELGQFSEITYDLKKDGSVNLMFFLGSTLGNHSDLNRVLTNFRDSMSSKDYLIVGVELTNLAKVQKIILHYQTKAVEDFTTYILGFLKIPKTEYSFEALWNDKYNQIEARASFKNDVNVSISGENFVLQKGENILLARSIKFTEYTVTKLFSDVGFRTELLTTAADRGYVLTMIQPTRYSV
jgi:uncharacterized SAM-dependent methyltransferase